MTDEEKKVRQTLAVSVSNYGFEWLGFWLGLAWIIVDKC